MIYIVDIESVETRYTAEWKKYLPKQLRRSTNQDVTTISVISYTQGAMNDDADCA